jgi:hypothetical protein
MADDNRTNAVTVPITIPVAEPIAVPITIPVAISVTEPIPIAIIIIPIADVEAAGAAIAVVAELAAHAIDPRDQTALLLG